MSDSPTVSVVIPVYNRERFLAKAVDGILAQTFQDFELILIDDCSTEQGAVELMRSYLRDPRVRLVRNDVNRGIAWVHNHSLELARGRYIAALDSDDYAYPKRLEKQVAFLDAHLRYALVGSWTRRINEAGGRLWRVRRYPEDPDTLRALLLFRCYINHPATMGRTAIMRRYAYREEFALANDFDLFVRLSRDHDLGSLPEVLVATRTHSARATSDRAQVKRENLPILAGQLDELGAEFDADDLDRHFVITRKASWLKPDAQYLEWAGAWLRRLCDANQGSRRYREPAFSDVLAGIWRILCRRSVRQLGLSAVRHYWESPLGARAQASSTSR